MGKTSVDPLSNAKAVIGARLLPLGVQFESDKAAQMRLLCAGLRSAVEGSNATYVSGPISGGERLLVWHDSEGRFLTPGSAEYLAAKDRAVVAPNVADGRSAATSLRGQDGVVIEPFSLQIEGWSQRDYRTHWCCVILEFARRVVLLDGWALSAGAALECYLALSLRMDVKHGDKSLSAAAALLDVERGIERGTRLNLDVQYLRSVAAALRALPPTTGS